MKSIPYQVRESTDPRPHHIWHDESSPGWISRFIDWVHSWRG